MFQSLRIRLALITIITIGTIYILLPTYNQFFLDFSKNSNDELISTYPNAIKLGLDLQGGMYVLLELDTPTLVTKITGKINKKIEKIIADSEQASIDNITDFFDEFLFLTDQADTRLSKYYPNLRKLSNSENFDNKAIIEILKQSRSDAISSAIQILRNRIDEFGVSEPVIQKLGLNRIVVELAGIQDSNRARKLIQRTASLELSLVMDERFSTIFSKLDNFLLSDNYQLSNKDTITVLASDKSNAEEILLSSKSSNNQIDELNDDVIK